MKCSEGTLRETRGRIIDEDNTPERLPALMWPEAKERQGQRDRKSQRGMKKESESITSVCVCVSALLGASYSVGYTE